MVVGHRMTLHSPLAWANMHDGHWSVHLEASCGPGQKGCMQMSTGEPIKNFTREPREQTGCLNQHFPFSLIKSMPLFVFQCACVCMCASVHTWAHVMCVCTPSQHPCEVKRQPQEAVLSFHHESPREHTQVGLAAMPLPAEPLHPSTSPFLSLFPLTPKSPREWSENYEVNMWNIPFIPSLSYHSSLFIRPELSYNARPLKCTTCPIKITSCSCATAVGGLWSPCQSAFYTQSWLPDPSPLLPSPSSHSLCSMYHLLSHTFVAGSCWAKQQFAVIYAA